MIIKTCAPRALIPDGPMVSAGPCSCVYAELNDVDHDFDQEFDTFLYLSTAPDRVTPLPVAAPGKPASATYIAPAPSNARPRGFLRPETTVVNVGAAAALPLVRTNDPTSAIAPASNVRREKCIPEPPQQNGHGNLARRTPPLPARPWCPCGQGKPIAWSLSVNRTF